MEIQVQSQDIIVALSEKIAALTVELETTKLGLKQVQEINQGLSELLIDTQEKLAVSQIEQHPMIETEQQIGTGSNEHNF